MNEHSTNQLVRVLKAVDAIMQVYDRVATGETQGAGGHFYADGKGTLHAVTIEVELLEALARLLGRTVHGRLYDDRQAREEADRGADR